MDVAFFRTHALTKGLTKDEMERLSGLVVQAPGSEGDKLFMEGVQSPGLFLIREGRVRVTKRGAGKSERTVTRLEAPTVLGELELISGRPCSATVIAETNVDAYVLNTEAFDRLVNAGDPIASKITRNIARVVIERLAETNSKLVSLMNE